MTLSAWLMYLTVVLLSTLTPGPAVLLAISNAIAQGPRAAAFSSLGNVVGLMLLSTAAMAGVGAILQSSTLVFAVLKTMGAIYLIYLGIRRWRSCVGAIARQDSDLAPRTPAKLFAQGALLAVTNPKAILFFAALFPQFIATDRPLMVQFMACR